MNTIDEAIEILQAMKEGKTLQIQVSGGWTDRASTALPLFDNFTYRVKPEPVFDWVVEVQTTGYNKKWERSVWKYALTEQEMKKSLDGWNHTSENYSYRARKLAPAEEALT